jgi:hypothetical protein
MLLNKESKGIRRTRQCGWKALELTVAELARSMKRTLSDVRLSM